MRSIELLPGHSSYFWHSIANRIFIFVGTPAFAVVLISFGLANLGINQAKLVTFASIGVLAASGVTAVAFANVLGLLKELAESRAGYTSMQGYHNDLPQIAPGTSFVIREAGGPLLSGREFRARTRAARSMARDD